MLKVIYSGINYVGEKAGEALTAGAVVMITATGVKKSDGTKALGLVNTDVVTAHTGFRSAIERDTHVGEPVGVYLNGGVYTTDYIVTPSETVVYAAHAPVYVTTEGKLTPTLDTTDGAPVPSKTTGTLKVGEVISATAKTVTIKLLV